MKKYTVDFRNVKYYLEMHDVIRESLGFPDYYGRNWDAFYDCITDMIYEPFCVEIIGLDNIERMFGDVAKKMIFILRQAKHCYYDKYVDRMKIEIVNGEHRIEIK